MKIFKLHWLLVVLLAFPTAILFPTSQGFSQSHLIINEKIDPGSPDVTQNTSDKSALYVFGGAIVAAVVLYAILKHNEKDQETDTTATINGLNSSAFANEFGTNYHQNDKLKDMIPVDLFLGIKENKAAAKDKTYLMGVSLRF